MNPGIALVLVTTTAVGLAGVVAALSASRRLASLREQVARLEDVAASLAADDGSPAGVELDPDRLPPLADLPWPAQAV